MNDLFPSLPPSARVWLFAADAPISDAALQSVRQWLPSWTSHARPVTAAAEGLSERILAVAAVITPEDLNAGVSGCGIDSMTHAVEQTFAAHGLAQVPALAVLFREAGEWQTAARPAFRQLARDGRVDGTTPVLDLTPNDLATLRADGVERPAAETWHGRVFRLGLAA